MWRCIEVVILQHVVGAEGGKGRGQRRQERLLAIPDGMEPVLRGPCGYAGRCRR